MSCLRGGTGSWLMLLTGIAANAAAAPLIDNEHVTVWDVELASGESSPSTPHDLDAVVLIVEGGSFRTHDGHGHSGISERHFGEGRFVNKGSDEVDS